MDYNFTTQDVLDKVVEIANRFPDYIYHPPRGLNSTCKYTDGADGQGCIVGQALRSLGVPYAVLAEYDQGMGGFASEVLSKLLHVDVFSDDLDRLDAIQSSQDHGLPWGQCVR